MNYLDEDTLVWDSSENDFVSKDTDMPGVKWHSVNAAQANIGFLHHFDKAENQLINISSELLAVTLKINTLPEPEDITTLRHQLVASINEIKTKGAELTYPVAVIDKLCFLYAVVLDELIVYTDWGEKRGWENKTLLSELFGMRNGGELFFTVAEKAARQPHKLIDLLEVVYLFLNIGFKGQYRETGSEQLKSFTYRLEQILSQYRQAGGIYCHTMVSVPKTRKPTRKKRYLVTTLFFLTIIGLSVALTYFWYNKTKPQRARDFVQLGEYSQRYIESGRAEDIVYVSTDDDLKGNKIAVNTTQPPRPVPSQPKAVTPQAKTSAPGTKSAPVTSPTANTDWLVQLATFSNLKNAEKFIAQLPTSNYQPVADNINSYVRVIVRCDNSEQANIINNWYRENANVNGLVVHNKNKQSEVESQ